MSGDRGISFGTRHFVSKEQHEHVDRAQPTAPMTINNSKKTNHCSIEISNCSPTKDDARSGQSVASHPGSSPGSITSNPEDKQAAAEEWQRERKQRAFRGGWQSGEEEGGHSPGHAQVQHTDSTSSS